MDVNVIIDELPFNTAIDHPSREKIPLPPGKKFHIFVSYRDVPRDKLWVKRVVDKLETEYGYTCCDHERDFLPGTKIMDNIKDGVNNSEKVVVVFSKEAIDSHYVSMEASMAYQLSLERRKNLLIPVLLDDCDVPAEYMLLTYIDAREGVEETTWWPKLLKSIEYEEGTTFAVNQLSSTETKYSCLRCSMEANTTYVPSELRAEAIGVPVDLIRATYKDLLQSPRVVCRQKCCCFLSFWVVFVSLLFVAIFSLDFIMMLMCFSPGEVPKTVCFVEVSVSFVSLTAGVVCCFIGYKRCYIKNPNSVKKNIIEYSRKLSKYGVMVTIAPGCMWKKASLVFYKCRFQRCKEYVIRHLVKDDSTHAAEYRHIPHNGQMIASTDDSPLLSGVGEPPRSREQSIPNGVAIEVVNLEEVADVVDVADDEPLLYNQETENLDYENKAMDLLLLCTPEYFALAYAKKLKNPKEDRHGIDVMCLCQYLEDTDKGFRKIVKRMQLLRRQSNIEENDQDEIANI